MSAWYVFNAMGFYPVNPASADYLVGSPLFDKMEVQFPQSANKLTVTAQNAASKQYVQSLSINGAPITTPSISHKDLLRASTMTFVMNDVPQTWGQNTL